MKNSEKRFGYVAIIGRPNVGKSTLLNHFLGKKVSITSRKSQTTRHRILGIRTQENYQIAYLDTPGLNSNEKMFKHRHSNTTLHSILRDVNAVLFLFEAKNWKKEDDWILSQLHDIKLPVILALNKVDCLSDRTVLLPMIDRLQKEFSFRAIVPISGEKEEQLDVLEKEIVKVLPEGQPCFPLEQWTDRNNRFLASEILREKIMRFLGDELPYTVFVTISDLEETQFLIKISAIIWVKKSSQKAILIGKKGAKLKKISMLARQDLQKFFSKKTFLETWVKTRKIKNDECDAVC